MERDETGRDGMEYVGGVGYMGGMGGRHRRTPVVQVQPAFGPCISRLSAASAGDTARPRPGRPPAKRSGQDRSLRFKKLSLPLRSAARGIP